ncbi:NHL repeat-containing protein [Neolewinella litorea]|uniref:Uncharacterized protein n=1 Tax=Neolewinella litorea TaxID=2562452 RepID=A0A4V3XKB0_9BACT|nr:hypothetical protein [Neolewinella litorea]THH36293.1 hypothetical protein E4021_15395 [Neolewinella litorea]
MKLEKIVGLDSLSVVHKKESDVYCVCTYGNYNEITKIFVLNSDNGITEIEAHELLIDLVGPSYTEMQKLFSVGLEHFSIQRSSDGFLYLHFYQEWDVFKFDSNGKLIDKIPIHFSNGHTCYDIKIENPDHLWLTFPTGHTIARINLSTSVVEDTYGQFEWQDTDSQSNKFLAYPESLWIDDEGMLYIPNMGNNKLFTLDATREGLNLDHIFDEPLWNYFKSNGREYVKLQSGTYQIIR